MNSEYQQRQQTEEQIRQRIRQQLQQRLPSLAQQLPDSDRLSSLEADSALQSFGGITGMNGEPHPGDFFNSDSFRATENSQQQRESRVVNLQHVQNPYNYFVNQQEEGEEEKQDNNEEDYNEQDSDQYAEQQYIVQDMEGSNSSNNQRKDDYITELEQVNSQEFAHQIIEALLKENQQLKAQVQDKESQLQKAQQWIMELNSIRDEVMTLKQRSEDADHYERIQTENEILKSKISDLETRVNTLSRAGDEVRLEERYKFEKTITQKNDENRQLLENIRSLQGQLLKSEEEIQKLKKDCDDKDAFIEGLEKQRRQHHEEYSRAVQDFQALSQQFDDFKQSTLQSKVDQAKPLTQQSVTQSRQPGISTVGIIPNGNRPLSNEDITSQRSQKDYMSLRNKSFSGDKGTENWISDLNNQVEQEFSEREKAGVQTMVDNISSKIDQKHQQQFVPLQPNQSFLNNINVKNYQPIQITIASPTEQTQALTERCKKLEDYCRELIRINKILDCENRIAIAQIINLTDPQSQLQNLIAALSFIAKSGKIYDQRSISLGKSNQKKNGKLKLNQNNNDFILDIAGLQALQQKTLKQQVSLRNLNTLRQSGAPPINQVFTNNQSSFIVQKFQNQSRSRVNTDQSRNERIYNIQQQQRDQPPVFTQISTEKRGQQNKSQTLSNRVQQLNTISSNGNQQILSKTTPKANQTSGLQFKQVTHSSFSYYPPTELDLQQYQFSINIIV